MEKRIIDISNKQKENLVHELAKLVKKFKSYENIECIYFVSVIGLGAFKGNFLCLVLVTNASTEDLKNECVNYNGYLANFVDMVERFGINIFITPDSSKKYNVLPRTSSEIIRANTLVNSTILCDKTGKYSIIMETGDKKDENKMIFEFEELAEIYPFIVEDDVIKEIDILPQLDSCDRIVDSNYKLKELAKNCATDEFIMNYCLDEQKQLKKIWGLNNSQK